MNFSDYEYADEKFRKDALTFVGLWGHPKANWAYAQAWRNGHEGGLEEVFIHLDHIADMLLEGTNNC